MAGMGGGRAYQKWKEHFSCWSTVIEFLKFYITNLQTHNQC